MNFLFDISNNVSNNVNTDNSTKSSTNTAQSTYDKVELDESSGDFYNNKYVITNDSVKNFIKSDVNKAYKSDKKNPYLKLLEDFNGVNTPKSLKLKSSDFAYLTNIGVMPINRLMILRRFPEGTVVPRDLNDLNAEPISVIVGWVKDDNEFLNFSFSEKWIQQGSDDMLHKMLNNMISKEFGINTNQIVPIPGWGTGFVFSVLNRLGLTDYNATNLPIGDPNILKESITRDHENMGLNSEFTFSLETSYEQKMIGDIDPTVAVMDILKNALTMGTSDIKFIGKVGSKMIEKLRKANENPTSVQAWVDLVNTIITGFISAIGSMLTEAISGLSKSGNKEGKTETKDENEDSDSKQQSKKTSTQLAIIQGIYSSKILKSILASTVAKYVWPLRGSIAMLTGEAATPWHLTIGNPYSPFFSMNNVYVNDVKVSFSGDLSYNDMPKYLNTTISMKQGRNMGKNEIYDMFGIKYQRSYKKLSD